MPEETAKRPFPKWAPKAGVVFAAITLVFFMTLVIASLFGRSVPGPDKPLIISVLALGLAFASAFIGGDAATKGRLPVPFLNKHPIQFSATGGVAVFVIVFVLGNWLYRVQGVELDPRTEALRREYCELLAPMAIHLDRTKSAFDRWSSKNLYLEAKIIRESNVAVRDLLLNKAHLIPAELRDDANRLVEHYDRWLEEFDRVRGGAEPDLDEPFDFVGPAGYPFPRDAERRFRERFKQIQADFEGEKPCA